MEQGTPGDYYYLIQKGRCEVSRKTASGAEPIKLAELSEGDSFGEEALVSDAVRNASITMTTDGELMRLTKEDFVDLIKKPILNAVSYVKAESAGGRGRHLVGRPVCRGAPGFRYRRQRQHSRQDFAGEALRARFRSELCGLL